MKFKVDVPTGSRYRFVEGRHKLTLQNVQWARAWACGEGWGRPRHAQAAFLSQRLRVAPVTIIDMLKNQSWYDPAYTPDQPDPAVWGGLSPTVAMLRLMSSITPIQPSRTTLR
jgi:hypothetical protein